MSRFSERLMDHFQSPRNAVDLDDADVVCEAGSSESPPFMVMKIRTDKGVARAVSFRTFGCGVSIACGSVLGELVKGRFLADCGAISTADLVDALDGIPEEKRWCADLAVQALRSALAKAKESAP
jgi:NifU-like protein involved in Fe-S cluster formation